MCVGGGGGGGVGVVLISFEKGSTLKGNTVLPFETKCFPFREDFF